MVVCTKSSKFWGDQHVLVVFHKISFFLQLFAKNLVKNPKHGSLHKKLLVLARSTGFGGFSQNSILFAKNLVKTLKHGSLHEEVLVLARSTRFSGF